MLTVIGLSDKVWYDSKYNHKHLMWDCVCDCGKKIAVRTSVLSAKPPQQSCGCQRVNTLKNTFTKHGKAKTRLYYIWQHMKSRCYNKNDEKYKYYGGRGITICDDWLNDYSAFETWAIANGYDEQAEFGKCTIDRIDNNGNYCPENCRWVDLLVQANNTRHCYNIYYNGESHSISEWARILNINYGTLRDRLIRYGWSIDEAFNTLVDKTNWTHKEEHLKNGIHEKRLEGSEQD